MSKIKFNRNYKVYFEIGTIINNVTQVEETLQIHFKNQPITCQFETDIALGESAGQATFHFFNLSRDIQSKLWKDQWYTNKYVSMKFYAGYEDDLKPIFMGDVLFCYTRKDGNSTDFITEIQALIGRDFYEFFNSTFYKNTSIKDIANFICSNKKDIYPGYITAQISPLKRNQTFIGQTMDLLQREYGGYNMFIQNNELNILAEDEVIPSLLTLVSSQTGLLGSPVKADTFVKAKMIFEPGILLCQAIKLQSDSKPDFNKYYKVLRVHHSGQIGTANCGTAITTITLGTFLGDYIVLDKESKQTYGGEVTQGQWEKPVFGKITGTFGEARSYYKEGKTHQGLDIAVNENTIVKAPASGKFNSYSLSGDYGNLLILDHGIIDGKKVTSYYAHLNSCKIKSGDTVAKGQAIALSGGAKGKVGSGSSQGPHLHFEIRENGANVNPTKYVGSFS